LWSSCDRNVTVGVGERWECHVLGADATIARLAGRRHGIVTRRQLLDAGVTDAAIKHRLHAGALIAVYRGVFAVGHTALSPHARTQAAIYACGPTAAASHDTGTFLHDLTPYLPDPLQVTITAGHRRRRPGLIVHRAATLETTIRHGLPVTTVQRTLQDLGWPDRLTREALARGLIRNDELPRDAEPAPTLTELERRMRRLCRDAGLPQPVAQHRIGPYRVDFAWPDQRVIVETDDYATHGRRQAFEDDRARDADLAARGYIVIRFTWRQITHEPYTVTARLAAALALADAGRRLPHSA
jgi:very-short-patch-repair endonuclease